MITNGDSTTTQETGGGFDLRVYLRVLRTFWRGALAIIIGAIIVAFIWNSIQVPVFTSQATARVKVVAADISDSYTGELLAKSRAEAYAQLAMNDSVAEEVARKPEKLTSGGGAVSAGSLLKRMTVSTLSDAAILQFNATGDSPQSAQALAAAWVEALAAKVDALDGGQSGVSSIEPLSSAQLPGGPSSPNLQVNLFAGGVVGVVLAIVYVLIRRVFDRRIRAASAIETTFDTPVVGTLPDNSWLSSPARMLNESSGRSSREAGSFAASESLRELRTNLSYVAVDEPPRVLVVTSAMPGEGKSTVAANLASAVAASGENVVIIDCDLRRPTQSKIFGLPSGAGLTDVLSGQAQLMDVLQTPGETPHLRVIGPGRIPPNPSELLGSKTMRELIASLSSVALVILDAPPLLPVTDAAVLAKSADGVVVVARAKRTTYDQFGRAVRSLNRAGGRILGVVLNRVPTKGAQAAEYGYYGTEYYGRPEDIATKGRGKSKARAVEAPASTTGSRRRKA